MPSRTPNWPAWPEFTTEATAEAMDPEFLAVKRAIVAEYGADKLRESWIKVCNDLKAVTDELAQKGNTVIPIFDTPQINETGFTNAQREEAKRAGAFICRNTIPEDETVALWAELKTYIAENKALIPSWPKESPSMLMLYHSHTQNVLRAHPSHLKLQRRLNELWHDSTGETSPDPLVYVDGVRDRAPGQPFLGLGPHIDAGSLCRWADPIYRKTYDAIFSGCPEKHDPYDLSIRKDANQELYGGIAHSTVLRTWQGWTAFTHTAPKEGTIMVYPHLKSVIAYVLLRPFFSPPTNPADIADAEKWTLDSTGWFPGTFKSQSQRISRSSHPHLRLEECLVHMPEVNPGDTVWWHSDLCHAVDTEHHGKNNASVTFIAACPTTPLNVMYVKKQLEDTLAGRPTADYSEDNDLDETKLKGYRGLNWLSVEGRKAFGFDFLETE